MTHMSTQLMYITNLWTQEIHNSSY